MGVAFSTAGRVSFRVKVSPNQVGLGRFANAVFRTGARVSNAERFSTKEMRAIVWLLPTSIPQFEALCLPIEFKLVTTRELLRSEEPEKVEE